MEVLMFICAVLGLMFLAAITIELGQIHALLKQTQRAVTAKTWSDHNF